jgi:DNA-binding LytR/AlgR family response regulator
VPSALSVGAKPVHLTQVQIKTRGRISVVAVSAVDWIEAQGNYVALHCGTSVHLLRETLSAFEAKLDPNTFVRVHRSRLVAVAKIAAIAPLANGDGVVRLTDGTELRLSRSYREQAHARVTAQAAA